MRNQHRILNLCLKGTAIFLIYAIIAILSTWPLVNHITTHITDHFGDGALHMWNTWWLGQALVDWKTPYFTDLLFFPNGVSLVTQNFAWSHIFISLLLEPFLNSIASYNVAVLISLTLCGTVVFWVAHELTDDARASFIAGLIYMMWPYRLARLDLPNMLGTFWVPLFLMFLIYSIERSQRRYFVMAGLFLALAGSARWQFLVPIGIMGFIIVLFYIPKQPADARLRSIGRVVMASLIALLLLLPSIIILMEDRAEWSNLVYGGDEEVLMSTDVLALLTPSQSHAVFGEVTQDLHDVYFYDREALRRRPAYIGLLPLLLAITGIYYYRRRALPWVVMALFMMLLAVGPIWRFNGEHYGDLPTLYGLLSPLGILEIMRNPERFVVFVAFPVAILAAFGTSGLLRNQIRRVEVGWLVTVVLGVIIFIEYFSPQHVFRDLSQQPSLYTKLAEEEGDFAVLNLPFDDLKARFFMGDQVVHQKAIVQGNISRIPDTAAQYINENLWLSSLNVSGEMAPEFPDISRQLRILAADDIRYLIIHKDMVGSDRIDHWQHTLMTQPRYEDATLVAYSTAPEAGRDFELAADWETNPVPVSISLSADCLHPGHVLVVSIGWGAEEMVERDLDVQLALVDAGEKTLTRARFPLVEGWPSNKWPSNTLAWGHYQLDLPRTMPIGDYELTATLLDTSSGDTQGQEQVLQRIVIQDAVCNLASDADAVDTNVLFGDELRLVEYTAEQTDNKLKLNLFWRAERFIEKEYSVFVHVADLDTAVPVAQDDGRPRDGAYAMRHWRPGEVVDDRVTISLSDVPEGEYEIAVGVYDPATGERLPIFDENNRLLVNDGRYVLTKNVTIP